MARLYTNENIPLPLAEALRALGHDVSTVAESGNAGVAFSDSDVLDFAAREERIVITLNRRHFIRLHAQTPQHAGIVVCSFDPDFARQARTIHELIVGCDSMHGQLVRVNRPTQQS